MTEMINEHEESTGYDLVSQIAEYRMTSGRRWLFTF